ncbi:phosphoserine phosphatase isoform X1 [Neodiprion virginianus]|uniref:phosphoserine phosphatase isoform X1 n=2 Tax=Neodiprion virginianus TaxID=2961670 RepID=UPI001EE70669|nr:phosphoserine phosphatase isoform X1 [Neodiprion virginianus]
MTFMTEILIINRAATVVNCIFRDTEIERERRRKSARRSQMHICGIITSLHNSYLPRMANLDEIKAILRTADAVAFDVDSTVIQDEGIDELAKFCGKGDDVTQLTKRAMQGNMDFRTSLSVRLSILQPSADQVKEFLRTHPIRLSPGIKTLVETLQSQKKQVFLISGGFRSLILPVAAQLNIPPENVFANRLKFYLTGEYAGFDETQPTSRSGGKRDVIKELKEHEGLKTIVHIGDGATDLEACPPADTMIGYGGNVIREDVKTHAPWFITDFNELVEVLQ